MGEIFKRIYQVVKKIPKSKAATYGLIAKKLGINPRVIGWALHANHDRVRPCHRVVDRNGRLAPGFAFGGPGVQKQKLLTEGVEFKDNTCVDLARFLVNGDS